MSIREGISELPQSYEISAEEARGGKRQEARGKRREGPSGDYKTYNYNRSFQAAQGAGAGLPPLMAVNGVGSVLFEVGHQFHPFADGLLVDGNQVVVTFGERFLQTAHNGLYGYVGTHCQQRAEKNHVVGF